MDEVLDEFYLVDLGEDAVGVSKSNAALIEKQFESGGPLLKFEDLYGSRHVFPINSFGGMYWSTPEYRKRVREHNEAIQAERKAEKSGWSEDD